MEGCQGTNQFGPIFEYSCDPILILNQELFVITCNPASEKFFKKTPGNLTGVHFCDLFDCNQSLAQGYTVQECLTRSIETKKPIQGMELLLSGHEFRYGDISGFHIWIADESVMVLMIRDITEKVYNRGQLEEWARTDPLTGLLNRRSLEKELNRLFMCAERYQDVFSLAMVDLDDLKRVNDQYGHHIGDQMIIDTAQLLKSQLYPTDFVSRYGGDEFILVFPNKTKDQASIAINCIERAVQQLNADSNRSYQLAFSYGIAEWSNQLNVKDMLELADKCMYQHKKIKSEKTF